MTKTIFIDVPQTHTYHVHFTIDTLPCEAVCGANSAKDAKDAVMASIGYYDEYKVGSKIRFTRCVRV